MERFFDVFGPFELGKSPADWTPSAFREQMVQDYEYGLQLAKSVGCYAFCLRRGETIKPWYIGKTTSKAGLSFEAVSPRNRRIYSEIISDSQGTPVMFLFPLMTGLVDRFAKGSSSEPIILWLEDTLMGMAFSRNPKIVNVQGMRFRRSVKVLGLIGKRYRGRPHGEVTAIRTAFFGE